MCIFLFDIFLFDVILFVVVLLDLFLLSFRALILLLLSFLDFHLFLLAVIFFVRDELVVEVLIQHLLNFLLRFLVLVGVPLSASIYLEHHTILELAFGSIREPRSTKEASVLRLLVIPELAVWELFAVVLLGADAEVSELGLSWRACHHVLLQHGYEVEVEQLVLLILEPREISLQQLDPLLIFELVAHVN